MLYPKSCSAMPTRGCSQPTSVIAAFLLQSKESNKVDMVIILGVPGACVEDGQDETAPS